MFTVYMLRCADGSFYVGSTSDLPERLQRHREGRAATWTAARRPVELVHAETFVTLPEAVGRERQLKRWSREKKRLLLDRGISALRHWSRDGHS